MPLSDLYLGLAVSASTFVMENRRALDWGITVLQYAAPLTLEYGVHQDFGGAEEQLREGASNFVDQFPELPPPPENPAPPISTLIGGQELEAQIQAMNQDVQAQPDLTVNDVVNQPEPTPEPTLTAPETPAPPTSTEIGGPQVDAHINEIKNLQAEHEKALAGLQKEGKEAVQAQATRDDTLAQSYFSGHPDQTPEERTRDEQKFEGAKQLNQKDVEATYETKTNDLKATQAVEMSTLQAKQMGPDAPPPPAPPPPPPPDLTRNL